MDVKILQLITQPTKLQGELEREMKPHVFTNDFPNQVNLVYMHPFSLIWNCHTQSLEKDLEDPNPMHQQHAPPHKIHVHLNQKFNKYIGNVLPTPC